MNTTIEHKERVFKTSVYQRRAYNAYLLRNRDNIAFCENRRKLQNEYYQRNKERILTKMQTNRDLKKIKAVELKEKYMTHDECDNYKQATLDSN